MKSWTGALLVVFSLFISTASMAQDPVEVGPNVYKKIFENDHVRVSEIHFNVGDKIAMHSHPDHFVYVLESGTLKLTHPDGKSQDFVGKQGEVVWIKAESHEAENIGQTPFKALVVELKDTPNAHQAAEIAQP